MPSRRFSDFVEAKDKMNLEDGLAGSDYKGSDAFPQQHPDYRNKVKPLPYKPENDEGDPGKVFVANDGDDNTKPLGSEMTPGMDQATSLGKLAKPNVKKLKHRKLTNEEFLRRTRQMSNTDLLDNIIEVPDDSLVDLKGREFTPEPNTVLKYVAEMVSQSPRLMDRFVLELKRNDRIGELVETLLTHKDTYNYLVEGLSGEEGKHNAFRFAKAMHDNHVRTVVEAVGLPPDQRFQQQPQAQAPEKKQTEFPMGPDQYGNQGKNAFGEPLGKGDAYSKRGQQSPDQSMGQTPKPPMQGGGQAPGSSLPGQQMPNSSGEAPMPQEAPRKKMRAESAADNLFNASSSYAPLMQLMKA